MGYEYGVRAPVAVARLVLLIAVLALAAAACGGGGSHGSTTSTSGSSSAPGSATSSSASPSSSSGTGSSQSAAKAAIIKTWTTFFNASTPASEQAALLQDGAARTAQVVQLRRFLPPGLTTTVKSVAIHGATATVTYVLMANGRALLGQTSTGTAALVNGKWLVSNMTFCSLISLEGAHC